MHAKRLESALQDLANAVAAVDSILKEMKAERDPLAVHIFISRRDFRNLHDTKSNKRHARQAHSTYVDACRLGFKGSSGEWERLLIAGGG